MLLKFVIIFVLHLLSVSFATFETDFASNQVLVQFDLVQLKDWPDNVIRELKTIVANFSTEFCRINQTQCKMVNFSEFTANNVVIVQGYPRVVDVNTHMLLYVTLPESTSSDESVFVLRKAILAEIITSNRIVIQQALIEANDEHYEASYRVSYVDNALVLEMSDQTLNKIITPIACAVVALMTVVIVGLEVNKRRMRKEEVKAIQKKRKEVSQSPPGVADNSKVFQTSSAPM